VDFTPDDLFDAVRHECGWWTYSTPVQTMAAIDPISPPDPRVPLAAERTLLAWVRTGLAFMGFGFVVARFGLFLREAAAARGGPLPEGRGDSWAIGIGFVGLGVAVLFGAGWRYRQFVTAVSAGKHPPAPGMAFGLTVTGVLIAAGMVLAVYLLRAE
jgi:putative membrane protein